MACLLRRPVFHSSDHFVKWGLERVGNPPQPDSRRIQNAPFHPADVGPLRPTLSAQSFLGEPRLLTKLSHDRADSSPPQVRGLKLASAPLHSQRSCCIVEADKPTAYRPHFCAGMQRSRSPAWGKCAVRTPPASESRPLRGLMRTVVITLLMLAISFAKDTRNWQECRIKYGERITIQPQNNTINLGRRGLGSMIADGLANKTKKVWVYVVDAGAQFYAVESKSALDIDIDAPTKYARKGEEIYILDRTRKERTLKLVKQMSREEAEQMATQK